MVNKEGGPKIEPCGSPYMILYIVLYEIKFLFLVFDSETSSLDSFSMQEMIAHWHVVLQLVSHDKCNQISLISQLKVRWKTYRYQLFFSIYLSSFRFLEPCRKTDVTFSNLKVAGNCKEQLASLIWRHICSEKYSAFSYKTLTGISVSWIAFLTVNLLISLSTVFLSTYEKWKLKIRFDKRRMILIYWYLSDSYNSEWLVKLDDCTIYCVDYLHSDFWILRFFTFQKKIF